MVLTVAEWRRDSCNSKIKCKYFITVECEKTEQCVYYGQILKCWPVTMQPLILDRFQ